MILSALLILTQQDSLPTAGEMVSKMIARYHSAAKISGTTSTTIELGNEDLVVNTVLQLERPRKLYLRQDVPSQNLRFVVTSDGKEFSYQKPLNQQSTERNPGGRLVEDFATNMGLGDVYRAAAQSLAERSAVIDLAISDLRDLTALRDQWSTLELTGKQTLNDEEVYRIVGKWRLNKVSPVSANFGLFITPSGDLRKYVIDQIPDPEQMDGTVTRTFVVNLKVDGDLDPRLFTVLK